MSAGDSLSVIIPSWREGQRLVDAVRAARMAIGDGEVVVVAYEEPADVRRLVRAAGAAWIDAPRASRGLQLQLGAARARGHHLLFLHADTHLPADAGRSIRQALAIEGVAGGAFRLRFDRAHPVGNTSLKAHRKALFQAKRRHLIPRRRLFCFRILSDRG